MKQIKVLIVDDSALVRKILSEILADDPEIEVVGTAADPLIARDKIKMLNPDVLTLDIEMPKMDGLTFLRKIMSLRPMPVVMISTLTAKGAQVTMEALQIGAVDFLCKPETSSAAGLQEYADDIIGKIKAAATARLRVSKSIAPAETPSIKPPTPSLSGMHLSPNDIVKNLIAIGASTGGTEAIREVLEQMPADSPPVVISQHIPAGFSRAFAERMDNMVEMSVCEASDGELIQNGHVYVAPGGYHLEVVRRSNGQYHCRLTSEPPVNRHRPSVDVLFDSVAKLDNLHKVAALLTGMGKDGAKGLSTIQSTGSATVVQDEKSSVVWGMPGAAVALDAADHITPLQSIPAALLKLSSSKHSKPHLRTSTRLGG